MLACMAKRCFPVLQLRSGGSQILEGCIAEIPNISSLDISDNGEDYSDDNYLLNFSNLVK